jgi:glycine/sarcosine N-methyltransferase
MLKNPQEFYQLIVADYDLMTRFRQRLGSERTIMANLLEKFHFETALDVACGTGLHGILLSQLGIQVVGTDISEEMLLQANRNARRNGAEISWIQSSMVDLTKNINQTFDAVLCLGNSVPHLLNMKDLIKTFTNFYHLLNKNGYVVLQLLNYQKILFEKKRIISVNRLEEKEFIRFYDFLSNFIQFNILKIEGSKKNPEYSLTSTLLFPYKRIEIEEALSTCGFSDLKFYGSLVFEPFSERESQNLIVVGLKS